MTIFNKAQDPISSETHFIGALMSVAFLISLIILSIVFKVKDIYLISSIIFGISAIMLYSASSIYHFVLDSKSYKNVLRRVDHSMIYVLIAGTYTPIVLTTLPFSEGARFLSIIWGIAILGIILKIFYFNINRSVYTIMYLALGWAIIAKIDMMFLMPFAALIFLILGGLSYSCGAIMYIIKKPNITQAFGFHEFFHIWIMLGTTFHFIAIVICLLLS